IVQDHSRAKARYGGELYIHLPGEQARNDLVALLIADRMPGSDQSLAVAGVRRDGKAKNLADSWWLTDCYGTREGRFAIYRLSLDSQRDCIKAQPRGHPCQLRAVETQPVDGEA